MRMRFCRSDLLRRAHDQQRAQTAEKSGRSAKEKDGGKKVNPAAKKPAAPKAAAKKPAVKKTAGKPAAKKKPAKK